jgi:hypothetical protein
VQLEPSVVGQLPPEVQLTATPPLLQLGGDPPVSMMVPQQTCPPEPQSEGLAHAKPASSGVEPELDPLPELLPELPPELLPLLALPPEPPPELLPELEPLLLPVLPLPLPELLPASEPLELPELDPLVVPELDPLLPPELDSPPLPPPNPPGSPPPVDPPLQAATTNPPASTHKAMRMMSSVLVSVCRRRSARKARRRGVVRGASPRISAISGDAGVALDRARPRRGCPESPDVLTPCSPCPKRRPRL